jgi:hypothetical protein
MLDKLECMESLVKQTIEILQGREDCMQKIWVINFSVPRAAPSGLMGLVILYAMPDKNDASTFENESVVVEITPLGYFIFMDGKAVS